LSGRRQSPQYSTAKVKPSKLFLYNKIVHEELTGQSRCELVGR
jgi:hypothetical protein